ncbi:uncharacterized protein LOC126570113 [Anopheles aquasalis]|nr:uncharacterized protein LOC126570113 [Anopheles aquasalis]
MVLNTTTKVFLLVIALFLTFVVGFFAYVLSLRHERSRLWDEIERRGAARYTEFGDTNYWYFVVRDIDKIRNMTDIHYLERASHIVPMTDGFILLGKDYEIHYERVRDATRTPSEAIARNQHHLEPEDYIPTMVKRKLYAWEVGKPLTNSADPATTVVRTRWKIGEHRIGAAATYNDLPFDDDRDKHKQGAQEHR